jgi:hypothetical protein
VPVHFLECAPVELAGRHIAGHHHEWHRVEEREIGRLAEPGPQEVKVAVGLRETR